MAVDAMELMENNGISQLLVKIMEIMQVWFILHDLIKEGII